MRGATICEVGGCKCATLQWEPLAAGKTSEELKELQRDKATFDQAVGSCRHCQHGYAQHGRYADAEIIAKLVKEPMRALACLICGRDLVTVGRSEPPEVVVNVILPQHLREEHASVPGIDRFDTREIIYSEDGDVVLIALKP